MSCRRNLERRTLISFLLTACEKRVMKEEEEKEQECFATMDEETAVFPYLSDFEFFTIILRNPRENLKLPDKFAQLLDGQEPREVKLREASGGRRVWDVVVLFDGEGHMYLERGWEQFARDHGLQRGHFLVFSYDGDGMLTVKVFDGSMCRRHYHNDDASSGTGSSSDSDSVSNNSDDSVSNNSSHGGINNGRSSEMDIDDPLTSQFTVNLKESHLASRQKQYLNVPPKFQKAHGYDERTEVELRMRGKKWPVTVKHNIRAGGKTRASLRYGWHQFCVDNGLAVGDVCFFRALGGGGEDHALKVEVRRQNGTFLN